MAQLGGGGGGGGGGGICCVGGVSVATAYSWLYL